jgi:hypothetical protein
VDVEDSGGCKSAQLTEAKENKMKKPAKNAKLKSKKLEKKAPLSTLPR